MTDTLRMRTRLPLFAVLLGFGLSIFSAHWASAQDVQYSPQGEQIPGPPCDSVPQWFGAKPRTCTAGELAFWLSDVRHWREERKLRIGFDASTYDLPALKWAQSSFVQPQMMVHDRYFYDPTTQKYTVDKYLADTEARYGGIDSVLVWHTYPNIGIDSRNQFDLLADMPGGVPALKQMIADFHKHNVKVFFPVMVWDQGTHEQAGSLWQDLAKELLEIGADGVNGDTLDGIPQILATDSAKDGHPLALEPETGLVADEMINYNTLSWGYWTYSFIPSISRYKWLEPRHMVHLSNRWAHDHLDDLQHAFFNGIGFESWENIWGIWNQLTPRDAETLRRITLIERAFAEDLVSPQWEPHAPTRSFGVFASKFPSPAGTEMQTLWTIVNRNAYDISDGQLRVPRTPGAHYYDLWHGVELQPRLDPEDGDDHLFLDFDLESHGYGAILQTSKSITDLSPEIQKLMAKMKTLSQQPLQSFSDHWKALPQTIVPMEPTALVAVSEKPGRASKPPAGMIKIPAAEYVFRVNGIEIEGQDDEGVDVQYPWENSGRRYHEHQMHIDAFWIDQFPVTNAEFKKFLDATHYQPEDAHNFLKDWHDGTYPENWDKKPVTWVSIEDARAYAKWAGKRLPHEWEWQYAAQGTDSRRYPWGNFEGPATPAATPALQAMTAAPAVAPTPAPVKGLSRLRRRKTKPAPATTSQPTGQPPVPSANSQPGNADPAAPKPNPTGPLNPCPECPAVVAGSTPNPDRGRIELPPSNVDEHPRGASPFGVMDLTGNIWQWTDEYTDEHTRAAILRGGSHYQPQGSRWYFPQAYELSQHGKYLLMAPSLDRSANVGFRCVEDAVQEAPKQDGKR